MISSSAVAPRTGTGIALNLPELKEWLRSPRPWTVVLSALPATSNWHGAVQPRPSPYVSISLIGMRTTRSVHVDHSECPGATVGGVTVPRAAAESGAAAAACINAIMRRLE